MRNEAHLEQFKREVETRRVQTERRAFNTWRGEERRKAERRIAIANAKANRVCELVYEAWTRNPAFGR